ncbi:hypothetical protein RB195_020919 [Necator americanus]|uniref:VWFA domain-containing protein n=1 Tax=Necator americanus TaxID=51031 RepID=A0ABR1CNW0_NECAM
MEKKGCDGMAKPKGTGRRIQKVRRVMREERGTGIKARGRQAKQRDEGILKGHEKMSKLIKWSILALVVVGVLAAAAAVLIVLLRNRSKSEEDDDYKTTSKKWSTAARSTRDVLTEFPTSTATRGDPDEKSTTELPHREQPHCLFVGDLYNFGSNNEAYDEEGNLIADIGYSLLEQSPTSTIGFWAYGHTKIPKSPITALDRMSQKYVDFVHALEEMEYVQVEDPLSTSQAIEVINKADDKSNRANCLIFFSAQPDSENLPRLDPKNMNIDRIVAIGFNSTDLSYITAKNAVALSIPYEYNSAHVDAVIKAIKITTKKTSKVNSPASPRRQTTRRQISTREVPDINEPHCVYAGDLLNFGNDTILYEKERDFIIKIGKKIFESGTRSRAGFWTYGYTSGPRGVKSTFENMVENVDDFISDVNKKMKYEAVEKPNLTTKGAIANLNNASDGNRNANCLVFFTGIEDPTGLSKLNPSKNVKLDRIVAVSLKGSDLSNIVVKPKGTAVNVSSDFTDEDVKNVVDAIRITFNV